MFSPASQIIISKNMESLLTKHEQLSRTGFPERITKKPTNQMRKKHDHEPTRTFSCPGHLMWLGAPNYSWTYNDPQKVNIKCRQQGIQNRDTFSMSGFRNFHKIGWPPTANVVTLVVWVLHSFAQPYAAIIKVQKAPPRFCTWLVCCWETSTNHRSFITINHLCH